MLNMAKYYYDIKGAIKLTNKYELDLENLKMEIQNNNGYIVSQSAESICFSSQPSEFAKLLPVLKDPSTPLLFAPVSQGKLRIIKMQYGILIKYGLSLSRVRYACILTNLASFFSLFFETKALAAVAIIFIFFLTWCWIYPMAIISVRDEFEKVIKKVCIR